MPITNSALVWLAERLSVPDWEQEKVNCVSKELEAYLKKTLSSCFETRWTVHRVIRGGSTSKGTAVRTKFDVDLVVLLNMKVSTFLSEDGDTQAKLKRGLVDCLSWWKEVEIDKSTLNNPYPTVGCTFRGVSFDVLAGVQMKKRGDDEPDGMAAAQLSAVQEEILKTEDFRSAVRVARKLSGTCVESISRVISHEERCVKQVIILLKHWRTFEALPQFKSFVAEMIVLSAAHRLRCEESEFSCLTLFARSLELLDIDAKSLYRPRVLRYGHLALYSPNDWSELIAANTDACKSSRRRFIILNPMVPVLNVIFAVSNGKVKQWSDRANGALKALSDKKTRLKDVFGHTVFGPSQEHGYSTRTRVGGDSVFKAFPTVTWGAPIWAK